MLTEEIRVLRSDHKRAMIRMPHLLSKHLQDYIFSLEDRKHMIYLKSGFKSEMGLDLRSTTERQNSRYKSNTDILNTDLEVFRSKPQLVNRQEHHSSNYVVDPAVYHLEAYE